MGIKFLGAWLAIVVGFISAGAILPYMVIIHDAISGVQSQWIPSIIQASLAFMYLSFFSAIALCVLGSLCVVFKRNFNGLFIALLATACTSFVFHLIAFGTTTDVLSMFDDLPSMLHAFIIIDLLVKIAIIVLISIHIHKSRLQKPARQTVTSTLDKASEKLKLLKQLKEDKVISEDEYKEQLLRVLEE